MTVQEMLSKFHLNGESTTNKGNFPIVAPKDFIEVESLYVSQIKKARDTTRMSDLLSIRS